METALIPVQNMFSKAFAEACVTDLSDLVTSQIQIVWLMLIMMTSTIFSDIRIVFKKTWCENYAVFQFEFEIHFAYEGRLYVLGEPEGFLYIRDVKTGLASENVYDEDLFCIDSTSLPIEEILRQIEKIRRK